MWQFDAIDEVERWLKAHPEIDGICCGHDLAAWAVVSAMSKLGKKAPEDIAVVGDGNLKDLYSLGQGGITTVDCCYEEFGRTIWKLISQMRAGEQIEPDLKIKIKGKLIVRHSTIGNGH